jgi:hypothetical protein
MGGLHYNVGKALRYQFLKLVEWRHCRILKEYRELMASRNRLNSAIDHQSISRVDKKTVRSSSSFTSSQLSRDTR